jgi:hypothetical protein
MTFTEWLYAAPMSSWSSAAQMAFGIAGGLATFLAFRGLVVVVTGR